MSERRLGLRVFVGGAALALLTALAFGLPPASLAQASKPSQAAATPPAGYAGAEACKGCHEEAFDKFAATKMGRLFLKQPRSPQEGMACESCHGPGKAHADAGGGKAVGGMISFAKNDPTPVETRNDKCLACHQKGDRLYWQGSPHEARSVACTGCHTVMTDHSPRAQLAKETVLDTCGSCHLQKRAQQMRSSHMPLREGKMTCTSCHNPHGTVTPTLLRENSANETCYTCHAEKRGPFLWPHPPVSESCSNCHEPHGSNHEKMLKVAKPRLCQQCHVESRHPTSAYGRDPASPRQTLGRSCVNCHSVIHGSNHPSGHGYTR